MSTMEELVDDVTTMLRFGSGTSVQIHLEPSIVKDISRCYRTLMRKYVWRDYYATTDLIIDEATGQAIQPLDTILTRFSNIIAVYEENSPNPIPYAPVIANPRLIRRPALVKASNSQIFTIYPIDTQRNVSLISKFYTEEDFEMDDEVPFYRDVLATRAAWELAVKAGTNDTLTQHLEQEYKDLRKTYIMSELQDKYQLNTHVGQVPSDWMTV